MSDISSFKILVPIKRVLDYRVRVKIKPDNTGVDLSNCKMSMNPFDEIAVEEAIQVKDKLSKSSINTEVVLVTIGSDTCQETLRVGLAMGADRAILQDIGNVTELYPLPIAKLLKEVVEQEQPNLVLMGKQSIDGDNNQTGQMLAGLLGWGQGTFISDLDISRLSESHIKVTREVDGGLQNLELKLPAVLTTDLRLNQPRYPSLPNIMKAKSKKLDKHTTDFNNQEIKDLIGSLEAMPEVLEVTKPPVRQAGVMVDSVEELVDKLSKEAKVI